MNRSIYIITEVRKTLIASLSGFSIAQLNKIPGSFNNNIIWNVGHMVAAQQSMCYKRAGVPMLINDTFFGDYKPDSKPERFIGTDEWELIKQLCVSTIEQLAIDLDSGLLANYTPFTTRYGIDIANIQQAVEFLPFHEGLHCGAIQALKKLV